MIDKKIKIAFITSSLAAGGAERNVINLSLYFLDKNYKVDVISLKSINDFHDEYGDDLNRLNIINIVNFFWLYKLLPILSVPSLLWNMNKVMRKGEYSMVIGSHEYNTYYISLLFSRLYKTKSILLIGNNLMEELRLKNTILRTVHFHLCRLSFRLSNALVCTSQGLSKSIKSGFRVNSRKIVVIYNGIDTKKISTLSNEFCAFSSKKTLAISTFGRLVHKKGFFYLINAFREVASKYPSAKLYIIGKGGDEKKTRDLVASLNLQNNVIFLGFLGANPYKYLKKTDLFIFSSLYEGFGNTLLEAMATGTPVMACDCKYGPREILNEDTEYTNISSLVYGKYGLLVPQFKTSNFRTAEKVLARSIIEVVSNKNVLARYGRRGLKRSGLFTVEKMGHLHYKLINQLINLQ